MAKIKIKNGKRMKKAVFNIGPILLIIAAAVAIFMIGRAVGKKERYYPLIINKYTKTYDTDYNENMVRQRLQDLGSI